MSAIDYGEKIPNNVQWEIEKAGGMEHVSETHRTWN